MALNYTSLARRQGGGARKQQDELLASLVKDKKPKAGALQRLLALPSAVGSIPDIIHAAQYEGKNPFEEYLKNLGQGVSTTFLGKKPKEELKTTSDILDREGILQGKDWGSRIAKGGLGFVGDVALDPTTYLTFGAGGLAKKAAQETVEGLGKQSLKRLATKGITKASLIDDLAKRGVKSGAKRLSKAGFSDLSQNIAARASRFGTKKTAGLKLPFAKKNLLETSNPLIAESANFLANPFGSVIRGGKGALRKAKPELLEDMTKQWYKTFDTNKLADRLGFKPLTEQLGKRVSTMDSAESLARAELGDFKKPINALTEKLPERYKKISGDVLEGKIKNPLPEFDQILENARAMLKPTSDEIYERGILKNEPGRIANYLDRPVDTMSTDFIRNSSKYGEFADDIINNPTASKEIDKLGGLTNKTLNEVIDNDSILSSKLSGSGSPLSSPAKMLGDSALARGYDTQEAGVRAGLTYNNDIFENMVSTMTKGSKAIEQDKFAKALPEINDAFGNKIFKEIKGDDVLGMGQDTVSLGGKKFAGSKDAVHVLKASKMFFNDEGMNKMVKGFDKIQGMWKASVTGLGPGFIGYNMRNAIGDMTNMMLDGFRNPKHVKTGIDVVRFKKLAESSGMAVAEKKFGAKIREIFLESTKRGVLKEDNQLITETGSKLLNKSQGEKFLDKTKNVGIDIATAKGLLPAREQVFRVAHFADTIDRTGSMDEAAAAVKRTLFEYQELAPTERNVFKRIIPFYSFMRKNAEFHLNNFAKSPGKYTALQHFLDNSKNLGADMTEEDWAAMPAWMKTGMAVATQKKDGKATLLTGFGLPTEAIGGLFGGEEGSLKSAGQNMLASSSPLAKIPLEMLTGKSFFSGKDIDENRYGGRYADMPKPLRDLLGYRENEKTSKDGSKYKQQTVDPMRAYIANNAPGLAPLLTQYKRILDAKEDPKNLVNLLSGARTYTRDIEQEKASREREMQEEIQRELFRRGIGSYYTNYNLGEEGRRELINN